MALWREREFSTLQMALAWLNGALRGSVNLHANGADVDGKSFIIFDGTADRTVNFAPAKGRNWTLDEIIAAIHGTHANLAGCASAYVHMRRQAGAVPDRRLQIVGDPAFTIRGNGTANSVLGFDGPATPANDTVQVIIPNTEVQYFKPKSRDPNQSWVVVRYS